MNSWSVKVFGESLCYCKLDGLEWTGTYMWTSRDSHELVLSEVKYGKIFESWILNFQKKNININNINCMIIEKRIVAEIFTSKLCQSSSQVICHHPQAIQNVFVSSSEQIWRNSALYHLLTNGSSAVNGCRQNPNSWLKHHNKQSTQLQCIS